MRRPGFFDGVVMAALLAGGAAVSAALFAPLIGFHALARLLVPALGLAYLLYLFSRNAERSGRVVTLASWSAASLIAWWLAPPLQLYLLLHAGALWLVRSLYFYSGALPALIDMLLSALAVVALGWALSRTGSVFLGIWCFFLVQALFVAIPRSLAAKPASVTTDDGFQRAHSAAQAALSQLIRP